MHWQAPELISNFVGRDALYPHIGSDPDGNIIAVWGMSDFTGNSIWASRYTPTGGWGDSEVIGDGSVAVPISLSGGSPHLAVSATGSALVAWQQLGDPGLGANLWANHFRPTNGWNSPTVLQPNGASSAQMAMHSDGSAIAVWGHYDGTLRNGWANRFTPNDGWQVPILIAPHNNIDHVGMGPVAMDANGNATVVLSQAGAVKATRYNSPVGWGTPEPIDAQVGVASGPKVAVHPSGSAIAVWSQSSISGTTNIWSNRYIPGQGWGTPELIETDDVGNAMGPQIAFDPNGNAVALWLQSDGQTPTLRWGLSSNRYTPGEGWGTAKLLDNDSAGSSSGYTIAFDEDGNALALWTQYARVDGGGGGFSLYARRYTLAIGWGTTELLGATAYQAQVIFDASGAGVAIWSQHDGTRFNIVTARFEAD